MLHGVIQQFFREVRWENIDYLIVDMPPGTGDVALSLSQTVPVAGAVVVTTPQTVSLADTRRAVRMYQKLNVPTLGLIENMSHFICPACRHESDIFGKGGGEALALRAVGAVPRQHSDLRADPDRRRHRRADHDRRTWLAGGGSVPRGGWTARRAAVDRQLQEGRDPVDPDRVRWPVSRPGLRRRFVGRGLQTPAKPDLK